MISEVLAEAKRLGRRRSIQALLGMAIVLGPLFHLSMQHEVRYQRELNQQALSVTQTAFQQGRMSGQEYGERLNLIAQDATRLSEEAASLDLPGSLQTALQTFSTGSTLFLVLAASLAFGSELAWGTYRNVLLVRRRSRTFVCQLSGLYLLVVLTVLVILGIAAIQGILYSNSGIEASAAATWRGISGALAGAALTALLWCLVGQLAAITARGAGAAVASAALLWSIITFLSVTVPAAREWNIDSSAAAMSLVGSSRLVHGLFLPGGIDTTQLPSLARAAAQLGIASVVLLLLNRSRFERLEIL